MELTTAFFLHFNRFLLAGDAFSSKWTAPLSSIVEDVELPCTPLLLTLFLSTSDENAKWCSADSEIDRFASSLLILHNK